jgi:hypothetical protein
MLRECMELYHVGRCLPLAQFRFSMHLQPSYLQIQESLCLFVNFFFFWFDAAYLGLVPRHLILLLDILVRFTLVA